MPTNRVCVLKRHEVIDWKRTGIDPDCRAHPHVGRREARLMCSGQGPYLRRVASELDPGRIVSAAPARVKLRIVLVADKGWAPRPSGSHIVMQMTDDVAAPLPEPPSAAPAPFAPPGVPVLRARTRTFRYARRSIAWSAP